jgi:hypothetical protein
VDWMKMTCVVQVAIRFLYTPPAPVNPYTVQMTPLLDVRIVFGSAGGFALTLPLKQGDEVLVILASRDITSWWQNGGYQNNQIEHRKHSLSDAFAIPGPFSMPNVLSSVSPLNAQLRTRDGTAYIELTPGGAVNIKAPGGVHVIGELDATQEITAQLTSTAIPLSTHLHPGVLSGPDDTGEPIP